MRVALLCFFGLSTLPLVAQVATGDVLGTVTDASGAIVPGASVKIENVGTREVRTFSATGSGEYTFSALQSGTYVVTVTSSSFKTFSATNIVVTAGDRIRIDAHLQAGSVDERVEVTATPTALQTDSTTVGSTLTEKSLEDAPVNGRNFLALVQVQAGVNAGAPVSEASGTQPTDRRLTSSISANGQNEVYNNNQVDGLDNNSRALGLIELRPSVEAIAEVRTDINLYSAETGRTGGAAINVITKSGTNQFHGSAYEFFRNDITDARNFFAPASLVRKPELRQNQFGGSLGGPIFRDKTFFFVDYEGLRRTDGNPFVEISTVPTAFEQASPGNLTDIGGPNIPTASLDPTALGYFKLFPAPNRVGVSVPGQATFNNFIYAPTGTINSSLADARIDHHFSKSDTLFGRYSYNRTTAFIPPYFPEVGGVFASGTQSGTFPGNNLTTAHNAQFGYTHIFTPSLLLELKTGYTYFSLGSTPLNYGRNLNDNAPFKVPNANECLLCSGLATIQVGPYATLGDSLSQPFVDTENNHSFAGSLTYSHGKHTFKTGGVYVHRNFSFVLPYLGKGLFIFNGASPAQSLAAFFNGAPYIDIRVSIIKKSYDRISESSGYFQDDWRATEHLTLNLGARYDVYTRPNEKYGDNSNFDINSLSYSVNATGGVNTEHHDFSPRIGFDATIAPGTVLRGGFGLAFFAGDSAFNLVLNNQPVAYSSGVVFSPVPISIAGEPPVVATSTTVPSGALTAKDTHLNDAYLEQFNLLAQKEYRGTVLSIGYVGQLGRHLFDESPNFEDPAPTGPVAANTPPPALIYATKLPNVTGINYFGSFGTSSYNSLQVALERRISQGLTANLNYTYAHGLDDVFSQFDGDAAFGLQPTKINTYDYGNSPIDVQSRFAGTFSYDLPFGKSGSSLYKKAVAGFRLNGLGFWQTGLPFTVTNSTTQANQLATINLPGVTVDRPNQIAPVRTSGSLSQFFNVNAFAQQPVGAPGNERRNQLRGPDLRRGDLSLFRDIPLHDLLRLELRAECFNITNTPNFSNPNADLAGQTGAFGSITSTAFGFSGRQYQFAGRFSF